MMNQACPLRDPRRPRLVSRHRPNLVTQEKATPHKSERNLIQEGTHEGTGSYQDS
jgi:hypothetical protein